MGKITVTVEGYGTVKVRRPDRITRSTLADAVGEAVAKTMTLVTSPSPRFHPALGLKVRA